MTLRLLVGLGLVGCLPVEDDRDAHFRACVLDLAPCATTLEIRGSLVEPRSTPVIGGVLLVHGLGGDRSEWQVLAESLSRYGVGALAIDLRGHGRSEGALDPDDPDSFGLAALDVLAGIDWLGATLAVPDSQLVLVGNSLGGGAAILAAGQREGVRFVAWYPGMTYSLGHDTLPDRLHGVLVGHIIQGSVENHPRARPALTRGFLRHQPRVSATWLDGPGHGTGRRRAQYERETLDSVLAWLRQ